MNILLFFFLLSCHSVRILAGDWQQISKGVSQKSIQVSSEGGQIHLNALKIDLKSAAIRPLYKEGGMSAKLMAEEFGALAVINANFFDPDGKVLGLVKKDQKIIHPKKNISWWSILCLNNLDAKIIHQSQYSEDLCHNAVQAGPRLVVDEQIPKLKDESSRKTAVGINKNGEVLFVVASEPVPIKTLAKIFKLPESENGLDCPNAMNLDGGSSSQLYVKTESFELSLPSFIKFPVGLGVFHR